MALRFTLSITLEALGALMSGAVKLIGTEECHVIRLAEMLHELRNKLVRGQAAEAAVLGRYDHMEASVRRGNVAFGLQTTQGSASPSFGPCPLS